jgi:hypothetical protein
MTMPRSRSDYGGSSSGDVKELGRHIVYSGPVLFNLTITFLVVRSFTDKPNGSNSIENQLSVVKRRTESKL